MSGRVYPKHPLVGVGAIVLRDDEILLVRRLYPPGKNRWSIPGGLVKLGEDLITAVKRELKEETNLEGHPKGILYIAEYIEKEAGKIKYHYIIIDFLMDVDNLANLKPGGDAGDVKFFKLQKALELPLTSTTMKLIQHLVNCKGKLKYIPLITSIIKR